MPATDPPPTGTVLSKGDDGRRFLSGQHKEFNSTPTAPNPDRPPFLLTTEHRRFTEFADTVRRHRYIGLCWGPPGVGKTLSARRYAGADDWDQWQHDLDTCATTTTPSPVPGTLLAARTALWTPTVTATTKEVDQALPRVCQQISFAVDYHEHGHIDPFVHTESRRSGYTELLIIDEADRLKATGLEQVRDYYDRHNLGVILIGMPGIERRLARYPQLYSRVGFAHEYRPLSPDELAAVLTRRWHSDTVDATPDDGDLAETVAVAAIARITGGNFRLVDRLLTQIHRIREINNLHTITPDVVDAAREALLIGS